MCFSAEHCEYKLCISLLMHLQLVKTRCGTWVLKISEAKLLMIEMIFKVFF